jgi:hypothetical protein
MLLANYPAFTWQRRCAYSSSPRTEKAHFVSLQRQSVCTPLSSEYLPYRNRIAEGRVEVGAADKATREENGRPQKHR